MYQGSVKGCYIVYVEKQVFIIMENAFGSF